MAFRIRPRDLWLPVLGAFVGGVVVAQVVSDLGTPTPSTQMITTTLGAWPGRPAGGVQAVGSGPLPPGLLSAATGMMAALENWRDARFTRDVQLSVLNSDPLGRWGYYDAGSGLLRVIGNGGATLGPMTVVHELCHALQDQHLDLDGRSIPPQGTDAALAWRALVEGEAMLAGAEITGVPIDSHGDLPQRQRLDDDAARALFLYMDGANFVAALREAGGWKAVDRAWQSPPQTSLEILDPPAHLQGVTLTPAAHLGPGQRAGAFALWRLLSHTESGRSEGRALVKGWRGDARIGDEQSGRWILALTAATVDRMLELAPAAMEAAGLPEPRAEPIGPQRILLAWGRR